jgi:hypothetical protein
MRMPKLAVLRGLSEVPSEVLLVSLATHFTAILLGISAATVLEGDAWPRSALQLDEPSVVLAIPVERADIGSYSPGEKVKLVRSGVEPCAFQSKSLELLSVDPVVVVSQGLAMASGDEVQAVVEWASVAQNHLALGGARVPKCKGDSRLDVVVERQDI